MNTAKLCDLTIAQYLEITQAWSWGVTLAEIAAVALLLLPTLRLIRRLRARRRAASTLADGALTRGPTWTRYTRRRPRWARTEGDTEP